jgi:hypothetical protein
MGVLTAAGTKGGGRNSKSMPSSPARSGGGAGRGRARHGAAALGVGLEPSPL